MLREPEAAPGPFAKCYSVLNAKRRECGCALPAFLVLIKHTINRGPNYRVFRFNCRRGYINQMFISACKGVCTTSWSYYVVVGVNESRKREECEVRVRKYEIRIIDFFYNYLSVNRFSVLWVGVKKSPAAASTHG